jgi:hypothetical protein
MRRAVPPVTPAAEALFAALRSQLASSQGSHLEVVGLTGWTGAAIESRSLHAILIAGGAGIPAPDQVAAVLAQMRAHLAPEGRLLWAGPPAESRTLRVALPEAGFVVRTREGPEGFEILVARPDSFVIRAYRNGDEDQILPLFEESFSLSRSRERWAWEYRQNPLGGDRISQAFDPKGVLVAHYAGYPVNFCRRAENGIDRLEALQIGDTMTAREVRHIGRGPTSLLGRTVSHFYARFCEGRVAFNYGFNTANIQRFSMLFVRAKKVEPVAFVARDLGRPWPRGRLRERFFPRFRVERLERFDDRCDVLFARVVDSYGLLVERGRRYLSWRYDAHPEGSYLTYGVFRREQFVGWGVFRRNGERLIWGDALFDPLHPEAVGNLLARVCADEPEARTLEGWFPPRPDWWAEILASLGFERRLEPDDLGLMVVPFSWDPEEDFRRRLYYTKGDGDLF